jgi:hypothetical protein
MIKVVCFLMATLIIVLALCIFSQRYLVSTTDAICAELTPLNQGISNGDWEACRRSFQIAEKQWEKSAKIWRVIVDHNSMRDIELSFADMQVMLKQEDPDPAEKELSTLIYYLRHVPENEKVDLQNIF